MCGCARIAQLHRCLPHRGRRAHRRARALASAEPACSPVSSKPITIAADVASSEPAALASAEPACLPAFQSRRCPLSRRIRHRRRAHRRARALASAEPACSPVSSKPTTIAADVASSEPSRCPPACPPISDISD